METYEIDPAALVAAGCPPQMAPILARVDEVAVAQQRASAIARARPTPEAEQVAEGLEAARAAMEADPAYIEALRALDAAADVAPLGHLVWGLRYGRGADAPVESFSLRARRVQAAWDARRARRAEAARAAALSAQREAIRAFLRGD